MALSTFVGSFTVPAATGNKAVTGVGFLPLAMFFWGINRSSDGATTSATSNADAPSFYGMAVSSSSRVVILIDDDFSFVSQGTAEDATKCIKLREAGVVKFAADFVSMDSDGFTVNFTTGFATADVVNFMALGGSDLTNASIVSFASQAGTGNQAVTGAGFKPDAIVLLGQEGSAYRFTIGFGVSSTSRGSSGTNDDGGGGASVYQSASKVFAAPLGATAIKREADLVSMDSDGFTVNWTTAATGQNIFALSLKGGQYKAGAITQKTSTGSQATTGIGFQPTGLLCSTGQQTAGAGRVASTILVNVAAASGSTHRAVTIYRDWNNLTAELNRTKVYSARADDGTPTLQGQADLTSFDAGGWTLNYGTADATAREIIYLAMGSAAAGAAPIPVRTRIVSQAVNRSNTF